MNSTVKSSPIRFAHFSTGGTIDSQWYAETPDIITPMKRSLVPTAYKSMGLKEGVDFIHHAWQKPEDSKYFLTEEQYQQALEENSLEDLETRRVDMDALIEQLLSVEEDYSVITHGTDALVRNAITLMNDPRIIESGKTIIMTAAMTPLANTHTGPCKDWHAEREPLRASYNFEDSDGYWNLKDTAERIRSGKIEKGVHIVANRGTFLASNEELHRTKKEFNTTRPDQRFFFMHQRGWRNIAKRESESVMS